MSKTENFVENLISILHLQFVKGIICEYETKNINLRLKNANPRMNLGFAAFCNNSKFGCMTARGRHQLTGSRWQEF